MQIYFKYIITSLIKPFLITLFTLTVIILSTQSIKLLNIVINSGVDFSYFFKLLSYIIPQIWFIILSLSLFIGLLYTSYFLKEEILSMHSLGINRTMIAKPIIYVAIFVIAFHYYISLVLMPLSYLKFKETQFVLQNSFIITFIEEKRFINKIPGLSIYVNSKAENMLKNIVIDDTRNNIKKITISALSGELLNNSNNNTLTIKLKNGLYQEHNIQTGIKQFMHFKEYIFKIDLFSSISLNKSFDVYELSLKELVSKFHSREIATSNSFFVVLHHKIMWPFYTILFIILILCFSLRMQQNIFITGLMGFILSVVNFVLPNLIGSKVIILLLIHILCFVAVMLLLRYNRNS